MLQKLVVSLKVRNKRTGEVQSTPTTTELPAYIPYWFIVGDKRYAKRTWDIVEEPFLRYWMAQLYIDAMSNDSEGLVIRDILPPDDDWRPPA
jgi:hypothetical protein